MAKTKYKYRVYDGKMIKEILENSRVVILIVLFASGIIIGSISIKKDFTLINNIKEIIASFAMLKAGQGVIENFIHSLSVNIGFVAVSIFLSFSLIGYPFILILPFIRGIAMGAVSGYLYSAYKFTGLGYSMLMIYPGAVISMIALVIIFNESCEYSKNAYSKSILGRGQFEKNETKYFLIRQLIFFAVTALGALVDGVSSALFSRFFNLG